MAEIYYITGDVKHVKPADGKYFKLRELQNVVLGYIEAVHLANGKILICNEEGKLNGFPVNPKATMYCRMNGLDDVIVGDVLIVDREEMD